MTESHRHVSRSSRCCAALTASTMVSELISSTKLDTEVSGMSHSCAGPGEPVCRPRYSMYVEMSPPNSRHSLPRNNHIASLLLLSPVEVTM